MSSQFTDALPDASDITDISGTSDAADPAGILDGPRRTAPLGGPAGQAAR
ncbi:hypothetical protein GCM10009738_33140 [Kitasatospora viridis]|uniref:Uncharacterized protein n=1 Tax=Kitasatospora viridis TaxID=281105 RepID=A0A561UQ98_9ACTN|nr:hypothetical protein FHX73_115454 [Kitasatospora viridis]